MQLDLFSEVNKCYSRFRTYLNEFEIQDNVGSKIGCNQPAAIAFVGMIRRHQNIFIYIQPSLATRHKFVIYD